MTRAATDVSDIADANEAPAGAALPGSLNRRYLPDVRTGSALESCCSAPAGPSSWVQGGGAGIIAVGRGPIGGLALSADGRRLLATNYGDDSVSVIDTETATVVDTIVGPSEPFAIAADPRGDANRAYIASATTSVDAVLALDMVNNDVVATCRIDLSINDLVVDPAGRLVYVARTGPSGADVLVIDTARGPVESVDLCTEPGSTAVCVRISPDGRQLYAAVQRSDGDVVLVLDTDLNLVDTIEVDGTIRDVAISPDGDTVFVAGLDTGLGGVVEVVNARAGVITDRFEVGSPVTQLTLSRDGERAYLVTGDGVVVMCTRTHRDIGNIALAATPSCAVESPDGTRLYIADYEGMLTAVSVAVPAVSATTPPTAQLVLDDAITTLLALEPAV